MIDEGDIFIHKYLKLLKRVTHLHKEGKYGGEEILHHAIAHNKNIDLDKFLEDLEWGLNNLTYSSVKSGH